MQRNHTFKWNFYRIHEESKWEDAARIGLDRLLYCRRKEKRVIKGIGEEEDVSGSVHLKDWRL